MRRREIALATVVAAACATTPAPKPAAAVPVPESVKSVPAAALEDRAGDSLETAVEVPAKAPNDGYDWENNWIYDRYGRFRRISGGMGNQGGRKYDQVKIELADHTTRTVYFDITENWKNWTPPAPPPKQ
jgi:hypothetical protein